MVNGLLIFSDNTVIASCIALYAEFKRDWFPDTSNSVFIAQSSFINSKKSKCMGSNPFKIGILFEVTKLYQTMGQSI